MGRLRRMLEAATTPSDEDALLVEIRRFFLQEEVDPSPAHVGAYTPFDMERDHTGRSTMPWYRSPGLPAGGDGDPGRAADPHAYLGMHPPAAQGDPTSAPPAATGQTGASARLAPPIWQLSAGSDTSKVLGANARPATPEVPSGDGTEEDEVGPDGDAEEGAPGGEAQRQEPNGRGPQRGRD